MDIEYETKTKNKVNKKENKGVSESKGKVNCANTPKNKNENVLSLDSTTFTQAWQETLDDASPYMPTKSTLPSLVIPIPDREDCLIISDNEYFYSPQRTFATLRSYEQVFEAFDYVLWSRAIRHFNFAGAKLLPMANRTSCLFPVFSSIHHALWINPLKIHDFKETDGLNRLIMTDGTLVETLVSRHTLNARASYALLALATIRRDYLYTDILGERPLDYLNMPNTPYLRLLSRSKKLHTFTVPVNDFKKQYEFQQMAREITNLIRRGRDNRFDTDSLKKFFE
ncbi:hypothetical protein JZO70_16760 [Enterococcus sp. 669A]|uniref:Uncharacterized protein n=1 Tax=Candidatus Enterococcus moelleringii TaxID=2815325 RepID=A0ABS3LDY6_9ENTE|nr:hypothetical protein [Enterococcus sp. 669A]MBO1307828.1 hypothetical protein [Enterococcus sp. 669A]